MREPIVLVAVLVLRLAASENAVAQPVGSLGVGAGFSEEHAEDGVSGGTAGGLMVAELRLNRDWSAGLDVWVPGTIREAGGGEHRDVLVTLLAERTLSAGARHRPLVLAGFAVGRTESTLTSCLADRDGTPTVVDCAEPDVRERRLRVVF